MRKKITLAILFVHLSACIFFSFDWRFLDGIYLGFGLTFVVLYLMTLPAVVGGLSLGCAVYGLIKKQISAVDLICGGLGVLIIGAYILSLSGALGGGDGVGLVYASLPFGVLAIFSLRAGRYIYLNLKAKK